MMMRGDEPWIQNGVRLIALDSRSDSLALDFKAFAPPLSFTSEIKMKAVISPISSNNNLVPSTATGAMTTSCHDGGKEPLPNRQEHYKCTLKPMTPASLQIRGIGLLHATVLFVFGVCSSTPFEQACHFGFSPTYFMPTSKPPCIKEDGHLRSPNGFRKAHFPVKQNDVEAKWISCRLLWTMLRD